MEVFQMDDIHRIFSEFKESYPDVYSAHEALGKLIHEHSGPLPEKTRWLLKIVISGVSNHRIALETHIAKAKEAGLTDAEIIHALLLLIPTHGFPCFMEAYSVFKGIEANERQEVRGNNQ
jgi:alkylhydroperoxidase/carboxymuconolactone decarboxylase family protein YurZ